MLSVQVGRDRWASLLDAIGRTAGAQAARVDAAGLGLGGIAAEHLPLTDIGFDAAADAITLSFERLEHRIDAPRAMYVEQDGAAVASVELIDRAGAHHIVQFTTALELPPA